jgi:phospholipid/cholesterol/gamma-HCH transport system substrate-binding protein
LFIESFFIEDRAVSQQRSSYAVGTGLFIVLGFAALAYLATQTSSVANVHQGASYTVDAHFANIGQLKERAPVKVAGVRIGQVQSITLEPGQEVADVKLTIEKNYDKIPLDSVATIYTSGLLGDQYIGILYGTSKKTVVDGGTLALTKPAQQLEEMIGKFFGAGGVADNLGGTYSVKARFTNIGALSVGAPVKMAGVPIGSVQAVVADPVKLDAEVTLAIDKRYNAIPDDSSAAVFTSGLIGSQYVAVQPGGSPDALKNGDEMVLTQSAMQLEDLIGKFMVNGSSSDKKDTGDGKPSDTPAPTGKH